jgi:RNA polymerase sigma factor (sigma-70 family)
MENSILETFERCQRRYPTVQLSFDIFQARVDDILAEMQAVGDKAQVEAFARIHHEDLFLATACAHDDRIAWEYFAEDYSPLLRNFAAQACGNPGEGEDLAQEIIAKLLNDKRRLAGYNGRGSLSGWLRVATAHSAVDRFRRLKKLTSLEELQERGAPVVVATQVDEDCDESLDSSWGPKISSIVDECLRKLPSRDRLILCLYYLQDVPLKAIGRQLGVSEATACRWLDRTRQDIRKHTERELRSKHGLRPNEMRPLWKWISPSLFAKSISGRLILKKTAMKEHSRVINKEELR